MKDFNIKKVGRDVNVDQSENNSKQEELTVPELLMQLLKRVTKKWL